MYYRKSMNIYKDDAGDCFLSFSRKKHLLSPHLNFNWIITFQPIYGCTQFISCILECIVYFSKTFRNLKKPYPYSCFIQCPFLKNQLSELPRQLHHRLTQTSPYFLILNRLQKQKKEILHMPVHYQALKHRLHQNPS